MEQDGLYMLDKEQLLDELLKELPTFDGLLSLLNTRMFIPLHTNSFFLYISDFLHYFVLHLSCLLKIPAAGTSTYPNIIKEQPVEPLTSLYILLYIICDLFHFHIEHALKRLSEEMEWRVAMAKV